MAASMFFVFAFLVLFSATTFALPFVAVDLIEKYYRVTPAGYVLSHCYHEVESGANLVHLEGVGTEVREPSRPEAYIVPLCNGTVEGLSSPLPLFALPADYDGWLEYTAYNVSSSFSAFLGNFSVPNRPSVAPAMLYIFTGLQNKNWIPKVDPESQGEGFDIIQPVLQYPGDKGLYWSVKSWYVTIDSGAFASEEKECQPGNSIFGNMTQTGDQSWYIASVVSETAESTVLTATHPRLATQPWAYNVLETYGVSGCHNYPDNSLYFSDLALFIDEKAVPMSEVSWGINPKPAAKHFCKESLALTSPTTLTISFGNEN